VTGAIISERWYFLRGNPITEWIVFSVIWLLLLIPVIRLTHPGKSREENRKENQSLQQADRQSKATAIFRYTGTPGSIELSQDESNLCKIKTPPEDETEQEVLISIEEGCAELLVQAHWPDDKQHVLELELIVEGEVECKTHFWAESELNEVATFRWPAEEKK